ncbi:MAG: DegT/DnrJ/EryC1/StrS family aminotransferase [Oscillospiraceae bacterium]|jgi:dTDP-4-amino-4,6-dideoxygalactose transaminase|nr:DegT/DnrJ/EryC1/StrS family aminotransferase [Oscillospiraceae bacterium]
MEQLAVHGGTPVKNTPFGTGMRFGEEELQQLREALEQNTLFYWHGNKVKGFCEKLAGIYGMPYCAAASSGTAAIHTAVGTLGIGAGDEVITTPITDMGTVIGILYEGAVPVFADLDPHTYNPDPRSIEERITERTKAIVVVHLAGNPSDMAAIMDIAGRHGLRVVEDCAQSWLSYCKGRPVGTFGDFGCFSTNEFKHISTGDGGALLTRDERLYRAALMFADKNYDRIGGLAVRNCEALAPNYRMTELQGAVGIAQLEKLEGICARRSEIGGRITRELETFFAGHGLRGVYPPKVLEGCTSSYGFYMLRIDAAQAGVDAQGFADALHAEGIPAGKGYIPTCIYEYPLFRGAYPKGLCPVAEEILETSVKFPINEFWTDEDAAQVIEAVQKVALYYGGKA